MRSIERIYQLGGADHRTTAFGVGDLRWPALSLHFHQIGSHDIQPLLSHLVPNN